MNHFPIYSKAPRVSWPSGYMTAANTTADLTSGTIYDAFTAGPNGSYVRAIRFRPTPAGTTTKTVARIWINNGSTPTVADNNTLVDEVNLAAVTADADDEVIGVHRDLDLHLPANYKIYITLGTASANGWKPTVLAGDY